MEREMRGDSLSTEVRQRYQVLIHRVVGVRTEGKRTTQMMMMSRGEREEEGREGEKGKIRHTQAARYSHCRHACATRDVSTFVRTAHARLG